MYLNHAYQTKHISIDGEYLSRFFQVSATVLLFLILLYAVERNSARAGISGDADHERGEIFVRDRFSAEKPLATNKAFFLVYAEPDKVDDPGRVANALSGILNL